MLHISICDDEIVAVEKMRKIVGKVLEQEQLLANVGTFENGEEFLNQYIIRDDELVILDLDMPIKSGIDGLYIKVCILILDTWQYIFRKSKLFLLM